jgi:pyridoxamine 5'-phosphate oxidase
MKGHDRRGFVFFTNCHSRKGRELAGNTNVALLFHWKTLQRQIRIEGHARPVDGETADIYFHTRPRDSQIGAVVSRQSEELVSRATLFDEFARTQDRFEGRTVPRPAHWSGYRVEPTEIEFWLDRPHRLHERKRFTLQESAWRSTWLYP